MIPQKKAFLLKESLQVMKPFGQEDQQKLVELLYCNLRSTGASPASYPCCMCHLFFVSESFDTGGLHLQRWDMKAVKMEKMVSLHNNVSDWTVGCNDHCTATSLLGKQLYRAADNMLEQP